ncbi:hypothetical protein Ciccas_001059 [Cichlidogyrus casuarinus]|uniref:ShKT domain-containing protein n=1 Tax=Cichlidogyrus casuarinus TaxID=1844966 RepID=A0ABD2QL60_9PLAT
MVPMFNPRFCDTTCASHLMGITMEKCQKEGWQCRCPEGYFKDGVNCVLAQQCSCLKETCFDVSPKNKCTLWKSEGRCSQEPEVMLQQCRATCTGCLQKCEDRLPTHRCKGFLDEGLCQKHEFYRVACQMTCNPESCHCPKCSVSQESCDSNDKTMPIIKTCYRMDSDGRCRPMQLLLARLSLFHWRTSNLPDIFERQKHSLTETNEIPVCPSKLQVLEGKCDYCKGQQVTSIISYAREENGQFRCIRAETSKINKCLCEHGNRLKTVQVGTKQVGCDTCIKINTEIGIKSITCPEKKVIKGKCEAGPDEIGITVDRHISYQLKECKCVKMVEKMERFCRSTSDKSSHGCVTGRKRLVQSCDFRTQQLFEEEITEQQFGNGCRHERKIVRKLDPVKCNDKPTTVKSQCNKDTCELSRVIIGYELDACKCKALHQKLPSGKCCCPEPKVKKGPCTNEKMLVEEIRYELFQGKCITSVIRKMHDCGEDGDNCPEDKLTTKCNTETNVISHEIIRFTKTESGCHKSYEVRQLKPNCGTLTMKPLSNCIIKKSGSSLHYRQIMLTIPTMQDCKCAQPKEKIILEACQCEQSQVHERIIKACPSGCKNGFKCDKDCFSIVEYCRAQYTPEAYELHKNYTENRESSIMSKAACQLEPFKREIIPCCEFIFRER